MKRKDTKKQVVKSLGLVNERVLQSIGACREGINDFVLVFGLGTELTEATCVEAVVGGLNLGFFRAHVAPLMSTNDYDSEETRLLREFSDRANTMAHALQKKVEGVKAPLFPPLMCRIGAAMNAREPERIMSECEAMHVNALRREQAICKFKEALALEISKLNIARGKLLWQFLLRAHKLDRLSLPQ